MNIAICSDKFSGTLSAIEVINIIQMEFNKWSVNASYFPVTDGGENSTEIFKHYKFKTEDIIEERDLRGKKVKAEILNIDKEIFFESSQLIGINNTSDNSLDLNTSCLAKIINFVDIIGLGGSRTVDGGIGLLSKLGINFYEKENLIKNPTPRDFEKISNVKVDKGFEKLNKKILVDTSLPLLGKNSAIEVFGPQKGLTRSEIEDISFHLSRIFGLISDELGLGLDPYKKEMGAAGGLGFVMSEILGCQITFGAEYFLEKTGLKEKIASFDISILCEGKFDKSSLEGKIIGELLKIENNRNYFLGGQYGLSKQELFEDVFECGTVGLTNPEETLIIATNKLLEKLTQN